MAEHPEPSELEGGRRLLTRKQALAGGGAAVAALGAPALAQAAGAKYPTVKVVELSKLRVNRPVTFDYPLQGQPNVLLDLGHAVPERRRARSTASWPTASCASTWAARSSTGARRAISSVPCHQSQYDPERRGVDHPGRGAAAAAAGSARGRRTAPSSPSAWTG